MSKSGVNIYPVEIEEVLNNMPGIIDAAVVGKKDEEYGETVAAFIVLQNRVQVSEDEIKIFCEERMAKYKIPSTIIFIDEIPRTPTGKILKRVLRQQLDTLE